ncbi:hypothetical protein HYC85_030196 [Camellia sinensis]|uniref:RING-type domain-containing protein n=1 Tax=Camellia sinensis TaxID=4442 RepID=A0A7J7G0U2_CAMSI|nr:hypothetical protein HYC85_030196 [Camellia sinensis]
MEKTRFLCLTAMSLAHCFLACLAMNVPNSTTDQSALLAFKFYITFDHPHHVLATNWSSATSVCDWIGVSCGKRHYRVVALNLPNMGIGGTIPPHIGNLSFLSYFNITSNTFHGRLPNELARLHRLNVVDFGVNNFGGGVPSWFGNLPKLQYLRLTNNSFTGSVPPSIGNISTLESLNLTSNFLEGRVPEEISCLPKLKWLRMRCNNLSGSIPPTIFNMSSLQWIDFTYNMMSGNLPKDWCVFLPKLEILSLSKNEFDGQIPSTLGECRELKFLSLSYNEFTGFIPKAIENLTLLRILYLGGNNFKGMIHSHLARECRSVLKPLMLSSLSLLKSAVSLTCNHVFCNLCIEKSMKSDSSCPVCKVPYRRREVRPAPHMDNLVSIYKSMEIASGVNIFVTQTVPSIKLAEEDNQLEGGKICEQESGRTCQDTPKNRRRFKGKQPKKSLKTNQESSNTDPVKPSFPTKKRVQLPQFPPSASPIRPAMFGSGLGENTKNQPEKSSVVLKEKRAEGTNIALNDANYFDSEMFEWTQRPCSPELCSSPINLQILMNLMEFRKRNAKHPHKVLQLMGKSELKSQKMWFPNQGLTMWKEA